jgi:hypothetical protein
MSEVKNSIVNVQPDYVHLFGGISMIGTALYVLNRYGTNFPIELVILVVAFVSYFLLTILPPNLWLKIRYLDWFITVPLLVYVVSEFGNRPYWMLVLPVLGMLLSGFLGTINDKKYYNTLINLGFLFYGIFFLLLVTSENSLPWGLIWIFFGSWILYGFVDRIEGPKDHWAYTALDIFNKPLFIILLLNVIG